MVRLGDICRFQSGGTPAKGEPSYFNGTIPWITTVALNGSSIDESNAVDWITEKAIENSAAKIVPANSVMVGTRVGVGKVAINKVPMSTSQDVISLLDIDENKWSNEFVCKFILGKGTYLNNQARGATIKGIKIETLAGLQLPDISLEQQCQIAMLIDNVDKLIALRKEQLAKLDQLVKSRFIELFGDLMENPHSWPIKKISDISILLKSGLSRKLLTEDIGLPMIRSCNIQNGQFIYDDIKYWYVDDPQGAKTSDYILDDGDILINFINSMSQIGKTAIFNDVGRACIYTTNIFRMKLAPNCNKYYYNWFAMTEYYYRQLQNIIQPAVNQASFTTVNFLNLSIPLPPLKLQEQFATFVEQTDKSKLAIQQSLDKLETLKKSLMQEYFG